MDPKVFKMEDVKIFRKTYDPEGKAEEVKYF